MSVAPPSASAKLSAPIDLPLVRRHFGRPQRVAESDFLRREVSNRMQERLALVRIEPRQVLDAGCGEGADLPVLQKRYPQAQVLGLDGALGMLDVAAQHQRSAQSSLDRLFGSVNRWLGTSSSNGPQLACGDFAQLPLAPNSLDLVWSNLALHWHPQPDRVFAEWRRVLRVEGLLMFSCFGPDSLREVRSAFERIDLAPHTLPFVDMHDFGDMLVNAGFSTPVMDMETITVTYDTPQRLLADVRAWGGNPLENRRRGLLSRSQYQHLLQALDAMRARDGKIPLTFEVVYGHAFRPVPRTTAAGESIIRLDFPRK
ncbi:methyltransferase domain-containing protein [Herbaspirillum sp. YR522]|uniref:methyltransferase domain-containing protein n=1 Tax=Herbaspirillum sp. YR522 TaxID=1144342 RepID=UPI00026F6DDD|nr:methyltransferase domain-containing protein [Herbaspirillum sp. YR522]EJN03322.1 methylase involved in ubiquinone/menaquinone biosynthesis [Herbaspirillum sp. YR522]